MGVPISGVYTLRERADRRGRCLLFEEILDTTVAARGAPTRGSRGGKTISLCGVYERRVGAYGANIRRDDAGRPRTVWRPMLFCELSVHMSLLR